MKNNKQQTAMQEHIAWLKEQLQQAIHGGWSECWVYSYQRCIDNAEALMTKDKFKNAPIHDKKAIIDMMDELEPKDMIEVVELLKSKQEKVVYEVDFGEEAYGEVRLINGLYRCFVTPQYGGDWQEIGAGYQNIEKAIEHIESWT